MTPHAIRHALSWMLLGGLLWSLFQLFQPFFDALAWAAVLAIFFAPGHRWVSRRLKNPTRAAFLSTSLVTVILIVPTMVVGQALIREAILLFNDSPVIIPRVWAFLNKVEGRIPWELLPVDSIEQVFSQASAWIKGNLAHFSATLASNLAQVAFEVSVIIFALFYFFRDGQPFLQRIGRLTIMGEELHGQILTEVAETVQVTVTALLLVSALQGFLGTVIYVILGLASPVVWGVVMGMASVVPVFGTAMVWAPQGLWLLVNGETVKGVVLLLYGGLVISTSDNFLRPLLITGRSQVNTLLVFIAVVGGMQAFGGVGAIMGPVVLSLATALFRAFDEHPTMRVTTPEGEALPTGE